MVDRVGLRVRIVVSFRFKLWLWWRAFVAQVGDAIGASAEWQSAYEAATVERGAKALTAQARAGVIKPQEEEAERV